MTEPVNFLTWFQWTQWANTRPDFVSKEYCYHRAKNSCEGDIDYMQIKTVYRNGYPTEQCRALCRKHADQLRTKGVPFVE